MRETIARRIGGWIVVPLLAFIFTAFAKPATAKDLPPWIGRFVAERVVTASSPDNTYRVLSSFYGSARHSILISVYQLDNPFVGDVLEAALDRGVSVRVIVEGGPIPKVPQSELHIARRLVKKGAEIYFYDISNGRKNRRFKYFHAKYGIVDGRRVIVGSANYGNAGHPIDNSAGNREWEIVLDDPKAARLFEKVFYNDLSKKEEWAPYGSSERYTLNDPDFEPGRSPRGGDYELALDPVQDYDVGVQTVFAPDNSLDTDGAILGTLASAQSAVYIQQLNFETYWGKKPYNPEVEDSPLMNVILRLARAGRAIRIMLNDDHIFFDPDRPKMAGQWFTPFTPEPVWEATHMAVASERDNRATRAYLSRIASREGLDLGVRLLDFRNCGLGVLHNKGMIVDGRTTLIGSLNWGESALKFNREAGVVVHSREVARYYARAFEHDWRCSR